MRTQHAKHLVTILCSVIALSFYGLCAQAQETDFDPSIGPVLDLKRWVRFQKEGAGPWRPLELNRRLFVEDKVRTGDRSQVSIQLQRQLQVKTILERTEAHFTIGASQCERPGVPTEQRRSITVLVDGLLHVVTHLFEEIHTPNAVICVEGTTVLIHFTSPPDTTEVINLGGKVTVWNQKSDPSERKSIELLSNSRVIVVGPQRDSEFVQLEELWREGPLPYDRDPYVIFLEPGRRDELEPQIDFDLLQDVITSDTSPAFTQDATLDLSIGIPR